MTRFCTHDCGASSILLIQSHCQHSAVHLSKPLLIWGGNLHLHLEVRRTLQLSSYFTFCVGIIFGQLNHRYCCNESERQIKVGITRVYACVQYLRTVPGRVGLLEDLQRGATFSAWKKKKKKSREKKLSNNILL